MLIINDALIDIDRAIEQLVTAFLALPEVARYQEQKELVEADKDLQEAIRVFQELKADLEELTVYASYQPSIRDLKRQLLQQKRQIDTHPKVSAYRQAELTLQRILADLTKEIGQTVSKSIFVDTGLPLAPHKPHHRGQKTNIKENMDEN